MSYIGSTPTTQSFIAGTDYFNGTGSQTAFTLSRSVVSVNDIEVVINNVEQQPNTAYTVSGTTITFTSAPSAGTNNIYVRYLSTTTQSITPSQNTVSYSTLNSDNQSKLGISFKNRTINGAMVIDQRNAGASFTPTIDGQYTLDRWSAQLSSASKYSIQQNAGSVTPPAGFTNYLGVTSLAATSVGATDYYFITQKVEGYNAADLNFGTANAKTVTLSFWVRSSLTGTFGAALTNTTDAWCPLGYTINSANTWEYKTITIVGPTIGTWNTTNGIGPAIRFSLGIGTTYSGGTSGTWTSTVYSQVSGSTSVVSTNGATFYVTGVQLEVGTQATTFDYRSYGTELALCQRYFTWILNSSYQGNQNITSSYSSTRCFTKVFHKVSMRTNPTVTVNSINVTINQNGNQYVSTSIPNTYPYPDSTGLDFLTSGATGGYAGHADINSGTVSASAEL